MAHYTTKEALEIAPKHIDSLRNEAEKVTVAFVAQDWDGMSKRLRECQWHITNLRGIARDESAKAMRAES